VVKFHFGCGRSKLPSHIGIDISPLPDVDIVMDLNRYPWPIADSYADECVLRNILEHLPDTVRSLEEIWRVTKHGGLVHILVPYYNSPGAFQDPTHVKYFTERTFEYFTPDGTTELSHYNYYSAARFEILDLKLRQNPRLSKLPWRWQVFLAHHFATVYAIEVKLRVVK
jgi:SAM-dependent methyltransferase